MPVVNDEEGTEQEEPARPVAATKGNPLAGDGGTGREQHENAQEVAVVSDY